MHKRLAGVEAKIDRAKAHADDVDTLVETIRYPDPYRIRVEVDMDARQCILRREAVRELPVEKLGAVLGDCFHNLRSSLDHIIWEVVEANGKRPDRRIQFPVTKSPEDFREETEKRAYRGLPIGAKEAVEAMQPYNRFNDPALTELVGPHPLATVHELNRIDKHRTILASVFVTSVQGFSFGGRDLHARGHWVAPYCPPESEEIIAVFGFVTTGENPQVDVNPSMSYEVALDGPTDAGGHDPRIILRQAIKYVEGAVIPRLSLFLD